MPWDKRFAVWIINVSISLMSCEPGCALVSVWRPIINSSRPSRWPRALKFIWTFHSLCADSRSNAMEMLVRDSLSDRRGSASEFIHTLTIIWECVPIILRSARCLLICHANRPPDFYIINTNKCVYTPLMKCPSATLLAESRRRCGFLLAKRSIDYGMLCITFTAAGKSLEK